MAELADQHALSTLGAEAWHLGAPLCVWDGNDGPAIRSAANAAGADYQTLAR